jgi:hypothetical protein
MTALFWDTALSTPGKPPSWLTEVPRPMVRHVGFAGSAGGPSGNAPITPDRANYQPTTSQPVTGPRPRRDAPQVNAAVGIVCINLRSISPSGPSPWNNRSNHAGTFTRGFRLFFLVRQARLPIKKRIFRKMISLVHIRSIACIF